MICLYNLCNVHNILIFISCNLVVYATGSRLTVAFNFTEQSEVLLFYYYQLLLLQAMHLTCGRNIFPAPNKSPTTDIPLKNK